MDLNIWRDNCSTLMKEHQILEAKRRHFLHQPSLTLEAWQSARKTILAKIKHNAGTFPTPPPLDMRLHGVIRLNGYELRKVTYQSRPGLRVTANLYVPDGPGPFPGVIGVHGHWNQGKIPERVQARGHILALNGFVVLMIDAIGAGERGTVPGQFEYHGAGIGAALFDIGESLLGMQVYDNMRGIDLLTSMACVDADHIGVTGASGGGNQTMWLAALDPRIKAAVPVVSVGTFEAYVTRCNCVCETLPNGLTFLEEWAVLGLTAPNALLILNSLQDSPSFCVAEMLRSYHDARQIYRLYGAEDKIAYQAFNLPHGYWPELQEAMLGWFKRWLKGEGEGRPCALPSYTALPEAKCLCFPGKKRPAMVASIPEYCRPIARRLAASHRQGAQPVSSAAKRRQLQGLLRLPAATSGNEITDMGSVLQPYGQVRKLIVESEPGVLLPVAILTANRDGRPHAATLLLHSQGKQALGEAPWIKQRVARGDTLILADLRGTGETRYDSFDKPALSHQTFHDHSRACLWLGRTMLGDWTRDIMSLVDSTTARLDRTPIDIIAFQETGLAALCAASLNVRIRTIITVGMPGSYLTKDPVISPSMAIHVPGILRWGDISMMAALAGCRVDILNPVNGKEHPYPAAQCRALRQEIAGLARRLRTKTRVRVLHARDPLSML
ncbi:MAG: acetylxylan esterase [Kiritimatiellae bacterium]|nr:acetylxylan esterase [Kiritimatiellia bacterium]